MDSPTQHNKPNNELVAEPVTDPVLVKRALISNWAKRASQLGYLLFGASTLAVIWGLVINFTQIVSQIASATLIAGCVVLAPAILVQYSVKAAVRDERERGI
jgi:hypothetical protein